MPSACFRVFFTLLDRADFGTATLRDSWQPRSLADLARWSQVSVATVKRALAELEGREWIVRQRDGQTGRGHRTTYALTLGFGWPEPKKVAQPEPVLEEKVAHGDDQKWLTDRHVTPAQPANDAGRAVRRGVEGKAALCTVCGTRLDPVLPAAGYRTHPCCDPDEKPHVTAAA